MADPASVGPFVHACDLTTPGQLHYGRFVTLVLPGAARTLNI
jgi:hypothetical protein